MDGKTIHNKLVGSDDERGVSPVIGVILMVAITVILAAVIATLVMDIGGNQEEPITAGVDVSEDGGIVTVTVNDMGNSDGVILADRDGDVNNVTGANTPAVTTTGTSEDYDLSSGGASSGENVEYIVYAYQSDSVSFSGSSEINVEGQTSKVAVVSDGEVTIP